MVSRKRGGPCEVSFRIIRPARSLHHGPVASPLLHELLVGSHLTDGASFQKEDVVSLLHGAEALGDEKHRAGVSLGALIQELLHLGTTGILSERSEASCSRAHRPRQDPGRLGASL